MPEPRFGSGDIWGDGTYCSPGGWWIDNRHTYNDVELKPSTKHESAEEIITAVNEYQERVKKSNETGLA
ncbi:MAG: hypothetical protein WB660_05690 [Candidatus Sulfotelmatobacter sp.]